MNGLSVSRKRSGALSAPTLFLRLLLWLVLLAGVGEAVARLTLTSPSVQLPDRQLGYVNQPHAWLFQANEGFETIHLNALGLNNDEVSPTPSGKRLLLIGDSMLLSHQVPRERNYPTLLKTSTGLDIINGGRDAMGPAQWGIMADRLTPQIHPDYDVMMMSRGDAFDLLDADVRFQSDGPGLGHIHVLLKPDPRDFVQDHFGPALRQSAMLTFLARRANLYVKGITTGDSWLGYTLRGFRKRPPTRNETAGFPSERITEQLAQLMRIAQYRQKTIFISIPSLVYHAHGVSELEPRSRIEHDIFPEAARRAGVPFIDLGPDMQADYARHQIPLNGFANSQIGTGHLNEYGILSFPAI